MDFIPYKKNEALQNVFIQIPVELFDKELYGNLNSDSILLYGLLLARLSLSLKNDWADKDGNIYLVFSRKEAQKTMYFAKLRNVPTSPRKMRLVVDMIRGMEVFRALGVLKFSNKEAAARVEKLLRSAIANWEQKNERKAEAGELCVSSISVDCATTLKRMRPAPQGRGYRIRKRSNHVTLFVDTLSKNDSQN